MARLADFLNFADGRLSAGGVAGRLGARRVRGEGRSRLIWATALGMSTISGMAGLAHQIVWTRRLVDLLGASPMTFAKVVGAFFVGLALGAAGAALYSRHVRRPWLWVAGAEMCVALLALPMVFVPSVAAFLDAYSELGWVRPILPFLLVGPPAMGMGVVMPWLVRGLPVGELSKSATVWLYTANTGGGVLGVLVMLLLVLPTVGLTIAGLVACSVNLLVALLSLIADDQAQTRQPQYPFAHRRATVTTEPAPPDASFQAFGSQGQRMACRLAFASGFLVLALEVGLQQQFAQVSINSLFSSATVLVWVLISLTAGAAAVTWLGQRFAYPIRIVGAVLLSAGLLCAVQPFVFTWLRDGVTILPYELPPLAYGWAMTKLALATLCPVIGMAGMLFPLLWQQVASTSANLRAKHTALLLAWNGVGGWLGAEIMQGVILPWGGLWRSVMLLGGIYGILGVVLWWHRAAVEHPRPTAGLKVQLKGAFAALLVVGVLAGSLCGGRALPEATLGPGERLATIAFGREGVVATVECGPGDWRMLFNNSYTLGGSRAQSNQERQAHLPVLLHGNARSVAVLGVATGSTVAGVALHPGVERIDAAELSPLVLAQAQAYFAPYNREVFADARVRVMSEDARRLVARQTNAYDVVIGDLFLPWRTGEGRLYSREHFRAVRAALKPGGGVLPVVAVVSIDPTPIRDDCADVPAGVSGRLVGAGGFLYRASDHWIGGGAQAGESGLGANRCPVRGITEAGWGA